MNPGSGSNAIANEKALRFSGYALIFLMMAGAAMTAGSLISSVLPDWPSGLIAGLTLCVVIERLYTYQQMKALVPSSSEQVVALGAQWVVIMVFIRLALAFPNGLDSLVADLRLFARGDPGRLFTPEFYISLSLALPAWYLCGRFLDLLGEIGSGQEPGWREGFPLLQGYEIKSRQRLANLVFSMGIVLVILTVMARLNLRTILSAPEGMRIVEVSRLSGGEAGALLYFIFGLALLSLSRLMSLQAHWNQQRIPISSKGLVTRWGLYSLFFVLGLAVIASLLPAGDSLGLFSIVGTLLGFLFRVLLFLSQLVLALVLLLFSLPFLLLGKVPGFVGPSALPALPTVPVELPPPAPGSAVWALIRSILLWGGLLGIIVFSLVQFARQHAGLRAALSRSRVARWLLLAWQWLYRSADKRRGSLSSAMTDGWQSLLRRLRGKGRLPPVGLIGLQSLDPRQRIYFFYLAMVRRGSEQGLRRRPSQTPAEYAIQLEQALPSAGEDIDAITGAFMEARYSRKHVDRMKAELVRATWGRIRRALQLKSKSQRSRDQ